MKRLAAFLTAIGLISAGLSPEVAGQSPITDAFDEALQALSPRMGMSNEWGRHDLYLDALAVSIDRQLARLRAAGMIEDKIPWWPTSHRGFAAWFLEPRLSSRKFRTDRWDYVTDMQRPVMLEMSRGAGRYTHRLSAFSPSYLSYPREPDELPDETLETINYSLMNPVMMRQLVALPGHPLMVVPDLRWAGISDK